MNESILPTNSDPNLPPRKPPKRPKLERTLKLPTPPPDPWEIGSASTPKTPLSIKDDGSSEGNNDKERDHNEKSNVTEKDKEVFDYIESLHKSLYSRSTSAFAPAIVTEEAFDHLEKLYRLMEQMLELREQNVKLHRRIRDLEYLNNLEKLRQMAVEEEYPDLEKDTAFAESILESILQDPKNKDLHKHKIQRSILRRHRSGSGTEKQLSGTMEAATVLERGEQERGEGSIKSNKPAKVSKWTKVKAAFRWEKASNVGDSKSQDSGVHVPINFEIARYLRVPSTSDEMGHSPVDSGAGISTPGSISSASSNDDFHRGGRTPCEDFRSSDDENPHNYIPHSKDYRRKSSQSQRYHPHRTPWAKMKDMINTRNSLKKKHRLSAASDDIQIDVEFCTDNEDVFEEDTGNKSGQMSLSPSPNVYSILSTSPSDIPQEIVERYQRALAEDSTSDSESKPSRWNRVRKAFLTPHGHHRHAHDHHVQRKVSRTKDKSDDASADEEIQQNFRKLQKKLSLEFQEKLNEWERMRQNSPGISSPPSACGFIDDNRDPFFMKKMEEWEKIKNQSPTNKHRCIQMTSKYELPPDFKKKLQEWEKIKKTSMGPKKKLGEVPKWKSLSGPRSDQSPVFEYPVLSEEFRKKLEEWKRIKASGRPSLHFEHKKLKDKTPSPKLSRKNSSPKQSTKKKDPNKEFHWFEKELSKIEKEKHRLERERQKFIEREERLAKLRRSMTGGTKKEVLIHTPSGFHRFEGISRKFTQKLYEWEKSQGIAPEASTFALLSASSFSPEIRVLSSSRGNSIVHSPPLARSKSADSIAISALNLTCPLLSGQPSSLSLNDMEELEKECLADSKSSSMQYLMESHENFDDSIDIDEPEAVLVEVEDYEEETAEPLRTYVQRQQLPVYQRQKCKRLCEGETVAAPKVRRSESARAQTNYDLMENIVKLLTDLYETEEEISYLNNKENITSESNKKFEILNDTQLQSVKKVTEKLLKLQEANNTVASNILKDETHSHLDEIMEAVQDISNEMLQLTEQINQKILSRQTITDTFFSTIILESIKEIRNKIADLRRHLSYICAATDLTTPIRKKSNQKRAEVRKTVSNESKESRGDTSDSRRSSDKEKRYTKAEHTGNTNPSASTGAVKKRIRYRQKSIHKGGVDTDEEDEETREPQKNVRQHKKVTRTRSISEGSLHLAFDQNLLVPTQPVKPLYESNTSDSRLDSSPSDSAVTLFVKTTRNLFTPLIETSFGKGAPKFKVSSHDTNPPATKLSSSQNMKPSSEQELFYGKYNPPPPPPQPVTSLPPLPSSPVPQRKVYKEVSPSIRLIMAKYNQKVFQQESGTKSGGSSGSNSPVAWRSPVSERRVKVQTERYQEELKKLSPLLGERREVQKSSSATYLSYPTKQVTIPGRKASLNMCNSPTTSTAPNFSNRTSNSLIEPKRKLTLDISLANNNSGNEENGCFSPEVRMRKIQRAKEEFLKCGPVSAPSYISEEALQFPKRNRLSQISVGSESSYDNVLPGALMKSASAGMINVDADVYKNIHPEYHAEGYVSLPRSTKKPKEGLLGTKSAFSTIASKFRKVKMRRGKEKDKNAVATLCRQSLVVDINPNDNPENNAAGPSGGVNNNNNGDVCRGREDSTTSSTGLSSISKSNSWIKRSLFRK